jgi:AraC-like DNA-binding protein
VNTAYRQGIETLGFEVGRAIGANCADPNNEAMLRGSPTLFHGLWKAGDLTSRTVTNCRMWLGRPGPGESLCFIHCPSCRDVRNPAVDQIGWYGLMVMLAMVQVFTGPDWRPAEIGLMMSRPPCRNVREYFPATRIRLNQPFYYLSLENVFLGMEPTPLEQDTSNDTTARPEYAASDFVGSVYQIVGSYLCDTHLNVFTAAELCGMSTRSFQRRLGDVGTSYSEILERTRFEAASRLLRESDLSVTEISFRLGYSNLGTFARAFRKTAGMSPSAYALSHQALKD